MSVRAKKHLGQHFLTDENIAKNIVDGLHLDQSRQVLEVGPGMGVLTKYLLEKDTEVYVAEIDQESVDYLKSHYSTLKEKHFVGDFLKLDLAHQFDGQVSVIGNFPYNISSQILFQVIQFYEQIPEVVGMFQKEVAERTAAIPRTKSYGILSVLVQALYDVEYLFTVHENVFNPPPKVKSGVIRMSRNPKPGLVGLESLFKKIVKAAFGQRRKKMSNSLKVINLPEELSNHRFMDQRAEELSVAEFIELTQLWNDATAK